MQKCRTFDLSDYRAVGLSTCRNIDLSDYRAVGLSIRTIWLWLARVTNHLNLNSTPIAILNVLVEYILFLSLSFLKIEITSTLTVNDHSSEYMDYGKVYVSTK